MKFSKELLVMFIVIIVFAITSPRYIMKVFPVDTKVNFDLPIPKKGTLEVENKIKFIVFMDNKNDLATGSYDTLKNLTESFNYSSVFYEVEDFSTWKERDLSEYKGIMVIAETYKGMPYTLFKEIEKATFNGTTLYFLKRAFSNPFNKKVGIETVNGFTEAKGLNVLKEIYPGLEKVTGNLIGTDSILEFETSETLDIIAQSEDKKPLIWQKKYGEGNIIYANTTMFSNKATRGLLKQLIAYGQEVTVYPIIYGKVFHIDDFPSPVPKTSDNSKTKDTSFANYVERYWWPSLNDLAEKEKLKYTGYLIYDYSNTMVDVNKRSEIAELILMESLLVRNGGELGVHGFNHQPLVLEDGNSEEDYVPWSNAYNMGKSIKALREAVRGLFGEKMQLYSYVGPSNILSTDGKRALINELPDLKSFSGIFYAEQKGNVLAQDVGRDNDFPDYYASPRFSSGYDTSEDTMWSIYNAIGAYGYISHFIHPDDVLDDERSEGKTFELMIDSLKYIFKDINSKFNSMNPYTQAELIKEYMNIEDLGIEYTKKENQILINVNNFKLPFDAEVRINLKQKLSNIEGGKILNIIELEKGNIYILKIEKPKVRINLGRG